MDCVHSPFKLDSLQSLDFLHLWNQGLKAKVNKEAVFFSSSLFDELDTPFWIQQTSHSTPLVVSPPPAFFRT